MASYRPLTDIPISLLSNSSRAGSGYVISAYLTGTTTPATLYQDAIGTSAGSSVTLDSRGEPTTIKRIWLDMSVTYKLVFKTDAGVTVWTADPVYGSLSGIEVDAQNLGCKGDGVTDDTTALNLAFSQTGKLVRLRKGTYRITELLNEPTCAGIIGDGDQYSIIAVDSGALGALTLGSECTLLRDFKITGNSTANAIGIHFGNSESGAYNVDGVRVSGFTGTDAVGIRINKALKSKFNKVTTEGCYYGATFDASNSAYPTTCHFDSCVFTNSTHKGVYMTNGWNIKFTNCDFESSAQEGVYMLDNTGNTLNAIVFDSCWFEANYGSNTGNFQFVAGNGGSSSNINPILRDCYFSTNGSTAKPMKFNGSSVDFVIDNPQIISAVAGSILVTGGAYGAISNWVNSSGMTYDTVVSDANNKVLPPQAAPWVSYTPTLASSAGNSAATFSGSPTITVCKYLRRGKTVNLTFLISGTLNAVTPTWISITPPSSMSIATDTLTATNLAIGGTYQSGLVAAEEPDNVLYVRKEDLSAFSSGAAVILRGSITFEIT